MEQRELSLQTCMNTRQDNSELYRAATDRVVLTSKSQPLGEVRNLTGCYGRCNSNLLAKYCETNRPRDCEARREELVLEIL